MTFIIIGRNPRCGNKSEEYGRFDNRRDYYKYLNFLKTGCLGDRIKFEVKDVKEVWKDIPGDEGRRIFSWLK